MLSNSGCLTGVTYGVAKAACESDGARLCTADEVVREIGGGTGCSHDARHVWTSNGCNYADRDIFSIEQDIDVSAFASQEVTIAGYTVRLETEEKQPFIGM
eukprot:TRINITY_DN8911_c0_g1_i1.p1 TRINITY_DN8911_c0_g1~~TRINITY_DN8911_c0_g1_i1.p1  ORF type:complete len:101 (+),score=8.84 TRINITY_DN8911_c0_g1_i1:282-584(+)